MVLINLRRVALLAGALSTASVSSHAIDATRECPTSISQWGEWRTGLIDQIRSTDIYRGADLVWERLDACSPTFLATIGLPAVSVGPLPPTARAQYDQCFGQIHAFATTVRSRVLMPNTESYLQQARSVNPAGAALPAELARNAELLELTSNGLNRAAGNNAAQRAVIARIQGVITRLNPAARVLVYSSQHFSAPGLDPNERGRLVVYYPGRDIDRWLQWGVPSQSHANRASTVSLISVVKRDREGRELIPPLAFTLDFSRAPSQPSRPRPYSPRPVIALDCRNCHENGPNPIWPAASPDLDLRQRDEFNHLMARYGRVPTAFLGRQSGPLSPSLGMEANRNPDNAPGCGSGFTHLPRESRQRVLNEMACSTCHNGVTRAAVDLGEHLNYVRSAITSGAMPPGNHLNEVERNALYTCLVGEVLELGTATAESGLIRALRDHPCDPSQVPQNASPAAVSQRPDPAPPAPELGHQGPVSDHAGPAHPH